MRTSLVHDVTTEFSLEGLRDYLVSNIDSESYGEQSFNRVFNEFVLQLDAQVLKLSMALEGSGIEFIWAVNMGKAGLSPEESESLYRHTSQDGTKYQGINAVLAFVRDNIDINELTDAYWSEVDRNKSTEHGHVRIEA